MVAWMSSQEVQTCGKPLDTLIERVLCTNILSSDYFKELFSLKTYLEIVDEIYNHVDHVEPWMTGNCRGPSTAFCLLYKLFTMKFTVKQMQDILDHPDSPYIRALGFLYLRYVGDPKTLWDWFEPYVEDTEEFSPGSNGKMTTMGVYVRDIILNQYYFDTLFPRIPVPILRQITACLERMKLPTQPSGITGNSSRHGADETARRPPSVKAALSVSFGQRAPHRAFTRDASPVRRIAPVREAAGADGVRDKNGDYGRDKRSSRDRERRDSEARDRGRAGEQEKDRASERERERSRDYDREGSRGRVRDDRDRDDDRDYSRYRDVDRNRDSERDRARTRDRGWERDDDRSRDRRRDRSPDRSRARERRYDGDRRRSRSRSPAHHNRGADRDRSRSPGRAAPASNNLKKLLDVYGDASHTKSENATNSGFNSKASVDDDVIHLGSSRWR
ncbi:pre-mRNA splicing factor SR-like 1 isoform X2 [Physcomitrium patens]|uniref:pre-mRNA splicing factor SR-like 1 isoform X2 n=1 Tax=Physcomitrium patens TaxID=3218 RepID=UPI000D176CD0|nr:pre-mRNA splicing factor SR-like 1 isoform X1 [Physcomitrium patens]|eukprot:XP_024394717.1 pre-mRNA splicing factor SR-like 1 isoform X1 [Physcomitrella patens]